MRKFIITGLLLLTVSGAALMQPASPTPTPVVLGAVNATTPTPRPPKAADPRPTICSAPYQTGWERHEVQAGDTLSNLMRGITQLSVTQAAALNCIDDPSALPVGSVVWLPPTPKTTSTCTQLVSDNSNCVNAAHGIQGAQQLFQNGMMIWRADTQQIYVIVNTTTDMQVFEDTYIEGEPDPKATPPNTFFVPKRGFGKIWTALDAEKGILGWATAPESQISLTVQPAGRVSYTTYLELPDSSLFAVTVIPDTNAGWWIPLGVN